jgi:hypothetical protein
MASPKRDRSTLVSTNGVTNTLSPCLSLLIEILVNEVTTHSSGYRTERNRFGEA